MSTIVVPFYVENDGKVFLWETEAFKASNTVKSGASTNSKAMA